MSTKTDELRSGGELALRGDLTIDHEQARAKLQKYRLPDPHLFVLQLVRAGSALGASRVDFTIRPMRIECTFDAVVPPDLLRDIWHVAFADRDTVEKDAIHYLAQGIGAMQSFRPARIELRSGTLQWSVEDNDEQFEEPDDRFPTATTRISLLEKFHFGRLPDFYSRLAGEPREVDALRTYCWFSSIPVTINGYAVDHVPETPWVTRVERGIDEATIGLLTRHGPGPQYRSSPYGPRSLGSWRRSRAHTPRDIRSVVRVLKHDVELDYASKSFPIQGGAAAIGCIDVPRLETDLSGLSAVKNEEYHRALDTIGFDAYHAALARWVPSQSDERKRQLLITIVEWSSKWSYGELPNSTRQLLDWLLARPLWRRAGKGGDVSMTEVSRDGALSYSEREFPEATLEDGPCLLRTRTIPSTTLAHLGRLRDLTVVDRTSELEARSRRRTNVARWRARHPRRQPPYRLRREIAHGEFEGAVYLPMTETGEFAHEPLMRLFLSSRFLSERGLPPGVSVDIDGPFQTNRDFSDIVGAESLAPLLSEAEEKTVQIIEQFVRELPSVEVTREHLALLRHWILHPARRPRLSGALGLPAARAEGLSESAAKVRRALGEVPCFPVFGRGNVSFNALEESDQIYVLKREGDWETFGRTASQQGVDVVLSEPELVEAHREAFGEKFRDARRTLNRMVAEQQFLTRPLYEETSGDALAETEVTVSNGTVGVALLRPSDRHSVDVHFLYEGRKLAERTWGAPCGTFRAVARTEALQPNAEFTDVGPVSALEEVRQAVRRGVNTLLDEWVVSSPALDDPAIRALWFQAALDRESTVELPGSTPCFPVVDSQADVRLVSAEELRRRAREAGRTLLLVKRSDQASPELPCVMIGDGLTAAHMRNLFPGHTIGFALEPGEEKRALAEFQERPVVAREIPDAVVTAEVDGEELSGSAALLDDDGDATAAELRLQALIDGRIVEEIDVPVPFGRFQVRLQGPNIVADPSYSVVMESRSELIAAARDGAALVIRDLCSQYTPAGHDARLENLVPSLLRYFRDCARGDVEPPFDLAETLASCPMLRTGDGTNTSLAQLARTPGAIPYTIDVEHEEPAVLTVTQARLDLLREAVPDVSFAEASTVPTRLDVLLLARVAGELRRMRGDRTDLIGDDLIRALRWTDEPLPDQALCRVTEDEVLVWRDASLVESIEPADPWQTATLTSVIATEINRYYKEITDFDELEIQRRILRSPPA